jgi:hypothetical protein
MTAENSVRTDESCLEIEENCTAIGIEAQVLLKSLETDARSAKTIGSFGGTEDDCAMTDGVTAIGGAEATVPPSLSDID